MNNLKIYTVLDLKAELYSQNLLTLPSDGVAIREFDKACQSPDTNWNSYPEDYSLYHVGNVDLKNGEISPITPKQIANASDFVKK